MSEEQPPQDRPKWLRYILATLLTALAVAILGYAGVFVGMSISNIAIIAIVIVVAACIWALRVDPKKD